MKRKKLVALILFGAILFSGSSAIAAENSTTDTLDIEKAAIMSINNSITIQSANKQLENDKDQYANAVAASKNPRGSSANQLIQTVILGPIEANNTLQQLQSSVDVSTNNVKLTAYSQYINLLKANYAANVEKDLVDNMESDENQAKMQLANGLITQNDERLVEINYQTSIYKFNSIQKSLDSAYMVINNATGMSLDTRYSQLVDNNITPSTTLKSLNDYVNAALTNRAEIVNDQNTLNALQKEYDYGKAEFPADFDTYCQNQQYKIDSAQNSLDEEKVNVQLEIVNGYKTLEGYMKAMDSQQANYDLAEANYESAKTQYNNSMITLSQFEDAEIAKAQAQMNLKNAQLDAWLEQMKMDNASGIGPALS